MLMAKYDTNVTDLKAGSTTEETEIPHYQFTGIYSPLANLTTFPVDVHANIQADIAGMLTYFHCNSSCSIGYNFWMRSCEKIKNTCCCPSTLSQNRWAFKGDSFMYGFKPDAHGDISNQAVPLSASQSQATLCSGNNNWPEGFDGSTWAGNPGIDNKQLGWDGNNNPLLIYNVDYSSTEQIHTSLEPLFVRYTDIDFCSAQTQGLSHKLFINFDHTWYNCGDIIPFIGLGAQVELGHNEKTNPCCSSCGLCNSCCCQCCNNCNNSSCCYCSLSQWGIWLKGGLTFN